LDALHPAVLRMIDQTCKGAAKRHRWVGVCGGLASDLVAVPVLVGLGVTELSATAATVPEVKALVRTLNVPACQALATPGAGPDLARGRPGSLQSLRRRPEGPVEPKR
jgi:phosphoenolpyruvate-protein kinase (PTS system EI component)